MLYVLQDDNTYFYSSVIKLNEYYDKILPVPLVKVIETFYLDSKQRLKL